MTTARAKLDIRMNHIAQILRDGGGKIVGRTKLQKTVYLLALAGFEDQFRFGYKHYGPFSEDLAESADLASAFGVISERQQDAAWGGTYSVYEAETGGPSAQPARIRLTREAARSDAVLLELAATAAYLAQEGNPRHWFETARRKPDKAADGRLERAKELYRALLSASDNTLPDILTL